MKSAKNTLFPTLTHLLGEINIHPTAFCGTHFYSVRPTLISSNKKAIVRESVPSTALVKF
jgi:hypothetical protein